MEAEYIVLSDITREVIYIRKLIEEINFSWYVRNIYILCDNQSAIVLNKENMTNQRSKYVDIRFHFSRKAQKLIDIQYVPTEKNFLTCLPNL